MSNKNKSEMKPLTWKEGKSYLWQSLGFTEDRANELDYRLRLIIHEVQKPVRRGQESPDSATFIKMCLALAESEEERVFCAYVAGGQVERLYDNCETFDEDFGEEHL